MLTTSDAALNWGERIVKWLIWALGSGTAWGLAGTVVGAITNNLLYGIVAGVVIGMLTLGGFTLKAISIAVSTTEPTTEPEPESPAPQLTPADTDSHQAQEIEIELGDTARLFLMKGARFIPEGDSERRTIFFPALLEHWVGPFSSAVEAGRTFVAHEIVFENCDIYGPVVFVLAEGSVEDTFHKCDWEEEWRAFWPATKRGRYVGVIALKNCTFKRCNFAGVAVVVKPDEYRRLYRRFTGADPTEQD